MANEIEIFAKRLRQARIRNKLSMEGLSQLVKGSVSKQAISKYEAEKMMPSSSILILLADALQVDVDYFFRPFAFDILQMNASFRKKASIGVKETEVLKNMFEGKTKISLKELAFVQESYGISIDAIMYKLQELGIISEKRYKNFQIRKNKSNVLKRAVEESRFKEIRISRFPAMVYSALALQLITTSKAASMLDCSMTTIRNNVNVI